MLHITSTTLELGQPVDIKDLEVISEKAASSSKEGFSSVYNRQINADTQEKTSAKSDSSTDTKNIDFTNKENQTVLSGESGSGSEATLDDKTTGVEVLGDTVLDDSFGDKKQAEEADAVINTDTTPTVKGTGLTGAISELDIGSDAIFNEANVNAIDVLNPAEQAYSNDFIHLLTESEKLLSKTSTSALPENELTKELIGRIGNNTNAQTTESSEERVYLQQTADDKTIISKVGEVIQQGTIQASLQGLKDSTKPTLVSSENEPTTDPLVKGRFLGKEASTDVLPGVKETTTQGGSNVTVSKTELSLNSTKQVQLPESHQLLGNAVDSSLEDSFLGKATSVEVSVDKEIGVGVSDKVELNVSLAKQTELSKNSEFTETNGNKKLVEDVTTLSNLVGKTEINNSEKNSAQKQVDQSITQPVVGIKPADKESSLLYNAISESEVQIQTPSNTTSLSSAFTQESSTRTESPTLNTEPSTLVKEQQTSFIKNTTQPSRNQEPVNPFNVSESGENTLNDDATLIADKEVSSLKQPNSVNPLLAEAQGSKEANKQKVLATEYNEKFDVDEVGEPSLDNTESEIIIDKPITKASFSPLFATQLNDVTKSEDNIDSRYNERFSSIQSVEGFSHKFVAENIQQNKLNVTQQIETININDKNFSESVKEKVLFAINQKLQQIDIQLDPPELGNVHVRVNVQNEVAAVNFVVQQQQTKDSLEQHMDKLKDMLSDSGVDLGDTNVKQENKGEQQAGNDRNSQGQGDGDESLQGNEQLIAGSWVKDSPAGVDFYA